jgi:uncharacterized membrane protein YccF (DUF307 family)
VRTIGNILWVIFAGIWLAIGYAISGLILCITVIGIPFGIQAFKLSVLALWPFGRLVVTEDEAMAMGATGLAVPASPAR